MIEKNHIPCTVAILTKNSGKTLTRALETVKNFRDIVICDGGSTDDTLQIAARYGARIIAQNPAFLDERGRISDFGSVRNQTLNAANEPWFFFLDSDEYISEELENEIRLITVTRTEGAFTLFRRYVVGGEEVMCATTYPNPSMRFFAKSSVERFIKTVHERIQLKNGVVPEKMRGALYVPVDGTQGPSPSKMDYYIAIQVEQSKTSPKPFYKQFVRVVWRHTLISVHYLLRLLKIQLFCCGKRMPLSIELNRHVYHIRLIAALWRRRGEFR